MMVILRDEMLQGLRFAPKKQKGMAKTAVEEDTKGIGGDDILTVQPRQDLCFGEGTPLDRDPTKNTTTYHDLLSGGLFG